MLEFTIGQVIEFIMYANTMLARRRDELDIAPGSLLQAKRSPRIYHANPNPASNQARSRGKNTNTIHAKCKTDSDGWMVIDRLFAPTTNP